MADAATTTPPALMAPPASTPRSTPVREDCWSEEATATLIEAWGRRYVELNRGNLRQKDWQEVADSVNALHGLTKKTHRTDVQCKNRIDTIKKKYKLEKGRPSSSWPFFHRLDSLIGPSHSHSNSNSHSVSHRKPPPVSASPSPSPPMAVPLLTYRKPDDTSFRRNYSAMAAAAAAAEAEDEDDDEDEEEEDEPMEEAEPSMEEREPPMEEGMRRLARAIGRFGEVYEKVEAEKLRQTVELEKQRMQFAKDLEVQRMRMFMDTQLQLERIKRAKRSNDMYG